MGNIFYLRIWVLLALAVNAQGASFYEERPLVTELLPARGQKEMIERASDQLGDRLMGSLVNFVAELRILYPDSERVYLGRDGELLYDLDLLVWEHQLKTNGEKAAGPRPQLVNISTAASKTAELYRYLKEQNLTEGREIILVDTGYEGSIIEAINQVLRAKGKPTLPAHLMSSIHPKSPSSRVSTQPFDKRKKLAKKLTKDDKEEFLDLVQEQVDTIEELAHYTDTATEFRKNPKSDRWDAYAENDPDPEVRETSVGLQLLIRKNLLKSGGELSRVLGLVEALEPFVSRLKRGSVDAGEVERLYDFTVKQRYDLFWPDLRESFAKGVLTAPAKAILKVWEALPLGRPELFDLEEDEDALIQALEAKLYGNVSASQEQDTRLFIEDILDFHASEQMGEVPAERSRALQELRDRLTRGKFKFEGVKYPIGRMLGEGVRAEVFELGDDYILKVPFEGDDTRYIAVEAQVSDYLEKAFDEYQIRVLPPLERGENGMYLIRQRVEKQNLGESIAKKGLSDAQTTALKRLFENTKRFAADTGVGLDIKYDNLAWLNGDWVLFDVGPRTSYGPYAFSLDLANFDEFYSLWRDDRPRENGITIKQVIDSHRNGNCAAELLKRRGR